METVRRELQRGLYLNKLVEAGFVETYKKYIKADDAFL